MIPESLRIALTHARQLRAYLASEGIIWSDGERARQRSAAESLVAHLEELLLGELATVPPEQLLLLALDRLADQPEQRRRYPDELRRAVAAVLPDLQLHTPWRYDASRASHVLCVAHTGEPLLQIFPDPSGEEAGPIPSWTVLHRYNQHWVDSEREARELAGELVEQEGWLPVPERDAGEPPETLCRACGGDGTLGEDEACPDCGGSGWAPRDEERERATAEALDRLDELQDRRGQ